MRSLYIKNFIMTVGLVLFSFVIIAWALLFIGQRYLVDVHREDMNNSASEVSKVGSVLGKSTDLGSWEFRIIVSALGLASGNHIIVTDTEGTVISCSDRDIACEHVGMELSTNAIDALQYGDSVDGLGDLDGFFDEKRYVVTEPINAERDDSLLGYVIVSTESGDITAIWTSFTRVMLVVFLSVSLVAMLMSLLMSKRMALPLDEMTAASRKFAHGDFTVRVKEDDSTAEYEALTRAFNNMANSLEKSEEMRNDFIANVSHELKTPMTTIAGFAEGILDGTIPEEAQRRYLGTIADETRRLSRLVRSMLDLAQMKTIGADLSKRKNFDLNELIIRTLLSFESRAEEKELEVDLQLPDDHMRVYADPDAITQVIYNLMDNAVKFASGDSKLTVSLWKRNGRAYISVKNRGENIPPDDLPHIFERFHKSDKSRSIDRDGTGLGLYLVKSILDAHKEDIGVTSREGVTEFVFTLTLSTDKK